MSLGKSPAPLQVQLLYLSERDVSALVLALTVSLFGEGEGVLVDVGVGEVKSEEIELEFKRINIMESNVFLPPDVRAAPEEGPYVRAGEAAAARQNEFGHAVANLDKEPL